MFIPAPHCTEVTELADFPFEIKQNVANYEHPFTDPEIGICVGRTICIVRPVKIREPDQTQNIHYGKRSAIA